MADGARPALGLSIGATNLAAVTAEHAITRKPVLTLYRQRPPEVGVPSENPRLDEPGLVITDFVDRVGDPIGIVAADGSMHRSEALVADGLRALAYAATGGRPLPESVAVTYPAHWGPVAVDALGVALSRVSEWSNKTQPPILIPDAASALFAVRANPGIPARGIVAICDFGGSGTSITLVDASAEYQPLEPTFRHHDFSGDLIDQSLLSYVMSEMPRTGPFDPSGTSAIGSLTRLRAECRTAKEQLSSSTATTMVDELPGRHGDIRLTRNELEDAIGDSLDSVVRVLEQAMGRNGIHAADLAAIVSMGGGATIPAVTTKLSGHFRVPVVTAPRPQLTAAIGGALRAARGPGDNIPTTMTPAASVTATQLAPLAASAAAASPPSPAAPGTAYQELKAPKDEAPKAVPVSSVQPALAWSEAGEDSRSMPVDGGGSGYTSARPQLKFERDKQPAPEPKASIIPWYRLPAVIVISTAVAVLLVGTAVAIGLSSDGSGGKRVPPPVSTAPASSGPAAPSSPAPASPAPEPGQSAPPPQAPQEPQPTDAPPPAGNAPPPASMTDSPPPAAQAPVTQQDAPAPVLPAAPPVPAPPVPPQLPPIPAIPPLPHIPGIGLPGIAPLPGIAQAPGAGVQFGPPAPHAH